MNAFTKYKIKSNRDAFYVLGALVAMFILLMIIHPRFLTIQNLVGLVQQSIFLLIISIGMTFVIIAGGLDLSVGSLMALVSSISAMTMSHYGFLTGVVMGLLIAFIIGLLNGISIVILRINPFIATLASMLIARGLSNTITNARNVKIPTQFMDFGQNITLGIPNLWLITLIICLLGYYIIHMTGYGIKIYAVGSNSDAAYVSSVQVKLVVLTSYIFCSLSAGVAGLVLTFRFNSGLPQSGSFLELFSIAAVVLGGTRIGGGRGGILRTVIGVFLIALLQNGLNLFSVNYYIQQISIGLVFILAAGANLIVSKNF